MEELDVHGKKVKIKEGSDSAKYGVEYLNKLSKEEADVFFEASKRDLLNGICHLETPHDGNHLNVTHDLTLIHHSDGTYELRKRTGH